MTIVVGLVGNQLDAKLILLVARVMIIRRLVAATAQIGAATAADALLVVHLEHTLPQVASHGMSNGPAVGAYDLFEAFVLLATVTSRSHV